MKKNKVLSFATAVAFAMASLPVLSVSAAETIFAKGDVDMDGVITGHDTAMVSRSLYDEAFSLTDEQTALADMNDDGAVDKTDLEEIHAQETYVIGDSMMTGNSRGDLFDAWCALATCSLRSAGCKITLVDDAPIYNNQQFADFLNDGKVFELQMNPMQFHLMDATGDGELHIDDVISIMLAYGFVMCMGSYYPAEGRYDLMMDRPNSSYGYPDEYDY